jgi:hypothetical protein
MLWLPGLLLVIAFSTGMIGVILTVAYLVLFHIITAIPFSSVNPGAYWRQSFDFGRQFGQHYNYNFRFLPLEIYQDKKMVLIGYAVTLTFLLVFLLTKWTNRKTFFSDIRLIPFTINKRTLDPTNVITIIFSGVLIAMLGAPGLHP